MPQNSDRTDIKTLFSTMVRIVSFTDAMDMGNSTLKSFSSSHLWNQLPTDEKTETRLRAEIAALTQEKAKLQNEVKKVLRQKEELFYILAEAMPVPVLISRIADGEILYANTAATLTLKVPVTKLIGCRAADFCHNPTERQQLVDRVLQTGYVQNYEIRARRADGTPLWVAASLRKWTFNHEPTILTALCDITDRKLEEEALRLQVKEMQIEIDLHKVANQVAEVTATDYFQQLLMEVESLRKLEVACES
ncbi:PAS domain-containing protein [Chlorogloeopsis sp. ULAP02]|uniref:PAS domain-containing protein n=1 Tax=Chlorogloeopsis sp. ULAP02 TaxID=3107926 RepID=UPI00313476F8